jgi:hypothetical protein
MIGAYIIYFTGVLAPYPHLPSPFFRVTPMISFLKNKMFIICSPTVIGATAE